MARSTSVVGVAAAAVACAVASGVVLSKLSVVRRKTELHPLLLSNVLAAVDPIWSIRDTTNLQAH